MKVLSHVKFDSLLDVGGAEGYTAFVAKRIFDVKVRTCDLSEEACLRAREIFHIDSDTADVHELPYQDNEFDVVICSATLEHVTDYHKAINELLRVAAKVVVVTVPYEDSALIQQNIEQKIPHSHVHSFTPSSFDYLRSRGYDIIQKKTSCRKLAFFSDYLIEPYPHPDRKGITSYPKLLVDICLVPALRRIYGTKLASLLVRLDGLFCYFFDYYLMLFAILKDKACYSHRVLHRISPSQIINITVPYHYLDNK